MLSTHALRVRMCVILLAVPALGAQCDGPRVVPPGPRKNPYALPKPAPPALECDELGDGDDVRLLQEANVEIRGDAPAIEAAEQAFAHGAHCLVHAMLHFVWSQTRAEHETIMSDQRRWLALYYRSQALSRQRLPAADELPSGWSPPPRDVALIMADALASRGRLSEAYDLSSCSTRSPRAAMFLADMERSTGEPELADARLSAALRETRAQIEGGVTRGDVLALAARLAVRLGDEAQARQWLLRAAEALPRGMGVVDAFVDVVHRLLLEEKTQAAEELLERAATLAPRHPRVSALQGRLALRRGVSPEKWLAHQGPWLEHQWLLLEWDLVAHIQHAPTSLQALQSGIPSEDVAMAHAVVGCLSDDPAMVDEAKGALVERTQPSAEAWASRVDDRCALWRQRRETFQSSTSR